MYVNIVPQYITGMSDLVDKVEPLCYTVYIIHDIG